MRRLWTRLGLPLIGLVFSAVLSFAPAFTQAVFAQGSYPSGGYMYGSGGSFSCDGYMYGSPCMGYQLPYSYHYSQPPAHSSPYNYHSYQPPHTTYDQDGHYQGTTTVYVVRRGDTLTIIARRFGVSVAAIQHANPYIADPDVIYAGTVLVIPLGHASATYGGYSYSAPQMHGYGGYSYSAPQTYGYGGYNSSKPQSGGYGGYAQPQTGGYGAPAAPKGGNPYAAPANPPMVMPPMGSQQPPAPPPAPAPMPAPGAQTAMVNLAASNLAFNMSTITVPAGAMVVVNFSNQDAGVPHNFAVYTDSSAQQSIFRGQIVTGPAMATYTFMAPAQPGTYFFRCDVHFTMMTGQFVVQ